jgi:MoaA/NifB/PqqE/SkfB family radical SAM enzyme
MLKKRKLKFLASHVGSLARPKELSRGTLFATRRCDKKCVYCFTKTTYDPAEELGLSESKGVIDMFRGFGAWYFAIYGGEPTLREDLPEIVKYARDKGMFNVLHTNGSFVNTDVDDVMNAGADIVALAIDSISNPKFKNYEEISGNFEKMVKHDATVIINHCIVKENSHEIGDMLRLVEYYKVPIIIHLGELPALPTNGAYDKEAFFVRGNDSDIHQVEEISAMLAERARKSTLIINSPEFFDDWPDFMKGKELGWKCRAGENSLCVDYDGTILPCVSATYPVELDGQALHYNDLDRSNLGSAKSRIKGLTEHCKSDCLSTIYMLEYHNMRNPLRLMKLIYSI